MSPLFMRRIVLGGALVAVLAALAVAAVIGLRGRLGQAAVAMENSPDGATSDRLHLTGVDYRALKGDVPLFSFSADEIARRPKKVGSMTIRPISQLDLKGVRITIHAQQQPPGPVGLGSSEVSVQRVLRQAFADQDLGLVTGATIERLAVSLRAGDAEEFRLSAELARIDLGDPVVSFEAPLQVVTASGQRLLAHRGSWDVERRRLAVESYLFVDGDERRHAAEGTFTLAPGGRLRQEAPPPTPGPGRR